MTDLTIGGGLGRDGVTVTPDAVIIHQRMGKGDKAIPRNAITEVSVGGGSFLTAAIPLVNRNSVLKIRAGSKKYDVRRLTNAEAKAAQAAILTAMI